MTRWPACAPTARNSSARWHSTRASSCSATSAAPRASSSPWPNRSADASLLRDSAHDGAVPPDRAADWRSFTGQPLAGIEHRMSPCFGPGRPGDQKAHSAGASPARNGARVARVDALVKSRGSPGQVIDGWRYFGSQPHEGQTDADMARGHAQVLLEVLRGEGFAQPNPRPMFPNPPGLLRPEPHSQGLRERIWWGAASQQTATWAAELGLNLQSSTLINNESDKPFHLQQAEQIQACRDAWQKAGHEREPRGSVSRSIFALVDDRDRAYFGVRNQDTDEIGFIDAKTQAIFGRTYAAEPDALIQQLKEDEAIAAADTLLLTVPSQLGVDYNAHAIDSILTHVAPALGWR